MFGPLPLLHRILLVIAALAVWIGLGAWSGAIPQVPFHIASGIALGLVVGVACAFVLLHDFHRDVPRPPRSHRRA